MVATSDVRPTLADVEAVLPRFTGPIEQMPPAFSALKVDGRRAYDLARAGEAVALEARTISIHDLSIRSERTGRLDAITLSVRCSKGTYVRSLARSEEHTSELQSLMRISYAALWL